MDFLKWIGEEENKYFLMHVVAIIAISAITEYLDSRYTTVAFAGIALLGVVSFMWNYPAKAVKAHGILSEFLIEMRVLWLAAIGFGGSLIVRSMMMHAVDTKLTIAALAAGIVLAVLSRNNLQEKIVAARGFK